MLDLSTTVLDNSNYAVSNKEEIDSNQYISTETALLRNLTRNLQWQLEA